MSVPAAPRQPGPPFPGIGRAAILRFVIAVVVLLAADLVVKSMAFEHVAGTPVALDRDASGALAPLPRHQPVTLIPKVLGLHLTVNDGAVFGLGQGGRWIFVAFSVIAAIVILGVFRRSPRGAWLLHIALGAVLAGAIGNLYDRVRFGVVRDMLRLFPEVKLPFGWTWPDGADEVYPWIFNIADVCLVVGLIVLMVLLYQHDRRALREERAAAEHTT